MNRRDFVIAAASTPLLTQLKAFAQEDPEVQGFVVLVLDVRSLPQHKVEAYVERVKEKFSNSKKKLPGWSFIFFPSRIYESDVEIYKVNPHANIEQVCECLFVDDQMCYDYYLEEYEAHEDTRRELEEARMEIIDLKLMSKNSALQPEDTEVE